MTQAAVLVRPDPPALSLADASSRLHIVHVVEPLATGPLHSIAKICWALRDGCVFSVLHGVRPDLPAPPRELFPPEVSFVPWPAGRALSPRSDWRALRALTKSLAELRPDIVHAHCSKAGALARLAALAMPLKVVYSPRGYAFLRRDVSASTRLLYWALERVLGRMPGLTVACGIGEYREALRVSRQVELVPNMIDMQDFDHLRRPASEAGPMTVVMCGEIRPQKNFALFCAIAQLCLGADMRFLWLGDGHLPAGLAKPDSLEISGWLPRPVILERLAAAQVFCQTSRWEGLPIAVLEAMALGLPVLAYPAVGNRELVIEGETGYLCHAPEAFAERLRQLAGDPQLRVALGRAGQAFVLSQHGTAHIAPRWRSIYGAYERYVGRI